MIVGSRNCGTRTPPLAAVSDMAVRASALVRMRGIPACGFSTYSSNARRYSGDEVRTM